MMVIDVPFVDLAYIYDVLHKRKTELLGVRAILPDDHDAVEGEKARVERVLKLIESVDAKPTR